MFAKIILVSCLVAAALARPDKLPSQGFGNGGYQVPQPPQRSYSQPAPQPQQSYSQPQPIYGPGPVEEEGMPFNYNYEVKDAYSGNEFGHNTDSDGDVTKGEYRVLLPDGRTQIVSYVSTREDGYKADVRYEGEIRVDQAQRGAYSQPQPTYQQPQPTYQQPEPVQTYQQPEPVQTYQQPEPFQTYQQPEPVQTYQPPEPVQTYQQPEQRRQNSYPF